MHRRIFVWGAAACAASVLAGCSGSGSEQADKAGKAAEKPIVGKQAKPGDPVKMDRVEVPTVAPVDFASMKAQISGFQAGASAGPEVVVFFDMQCGHCGRLWVASRALAARTRQLWVPVAFLSRESWHQGATVLAATNPIAVMQQHEISMAANKGGLEVDEVAIKSHGERVKRNTEVLKKMGVQSIPFLVTADKNGQSPRFANTAMSEPELAAFLGLAAKK